MLPDAIKWSTNIFVSYNFLRSITVHTCIASVPLKRETRVYS